MFGRSLGAGVVVQILTWMQSKSWNPCLAVLVMPFTSIRNVMKSHLGCCGWITHALKPRFETESIFGQITCPTLIMHGDEDGLVDISHARALFDLLDGEKV